MLEGEEIALEFCLIVSRIFLMSGSWILLGLRMGKVRTASVGGFARAEAREFARRWKRTVTSKPPGKNSNRCGSIHDRRRWPMVTNNPPSFPSS